MPTRRIDGNFKNNRLSTTSIKSEVSLLLNVFGATLKPRFTIENCRYLLVTNCPFSLTQDDSYAVDELWGYDLEAHLRGFPNLHIFAPFDPKYQADVYSYVFSNESTIAFHPLFSLARDRHRKCASAREVFENTLKILKVLIRNTKRHDIIQSAGPIVNVLVPLTLILYAVIRHRRRIFIQDMDLIEDIEVAKEAESHTIKRFFLTVSKQLMALVERLLVAITPLTFVVGDSLYSRYSNVGNVKKIYASWLSDADVITSSSLREKVLTAQKRGYCKLVYAASLFHKKGPDTAVKVAAILCKKGIPTKLDIYGAGPLHDEILNLIKHNNLSATVTLKGKVDYNSFLGVLTEYDILLLPNLSGEQPRVLFDAMAKGVLVIASNIISLSDIISNKYNGVLCDPGNPDSFASAIEQLCLNKTDLEPLLCNGLQMVKQYTIESMHENRKSIIQSIFSNS